MSFRGFLPFLEIKMSSTECVFVLFCYWEVNHSQKTNITTAASKCIKVGHIDEIAYWPLHRFKIGYVI